MITVFILGILGGLDSLQVASAAGLMGLQSHRRWVLVSALIFFDVTMTVTGLLAGNQLNSLFENLTHWLGPLFILLLGVYTIIREIREKEKHNIINNKWMLVFLPFLMSFDNLLTGLGLGTAGYPVLSTSLIIGLCSGGMGLLGLVTGEKLRKVIPWNPQMISGVYLIGLAVFLVFDK